jgi:hypothetical protein
MLQVVPVAEPLRADAGVAALFGVPCLDSHTNGTVLTPRACIGREKLEKREKNKRRCLEDIFLLAVHLR